MSTYTNWYHLDKYEGSDKPNLLDQYNSSMDKIDTALHQIANSSGGGSYDIEQRLTTCENKINNLSKPNFDYFSNYNAVFIGDSYTQGQGSTDWQTDHTYRYSSIVSAMLNMTEFNFAIGATGFLNPAGDRNGAFTTQIINARNAMSESERENTRLVVIMGGIGDSQTSADYSYEQEVNAVKQTCDNAHIFYPNALICLFAMPWKGKLFLPRTLNLYNAIVKGGFLSKNTKVCQGCYTWMFGQGDKYADDGVHPNNAGHARIAEYVLSAIISDNWTQWEDQRAVLIPTNTDITFDHAEHPEIIPCVTIKQGLVYMSELSAGFTDGPWTPGNNYQITTIPAAFRPLRNRYALGFTGSEQNSIITLVGGSGALRVVPTSNITNFVNIDCVQAWPLYGTNYNS